MSWVQVVSCRQGNVDLREFKRERRLSGSSEKKEDSQWHLFCLLALFSLVIVSDRFGTLQM